MIYFRYNTNVIRSTIRFMVNIGGGQRLFQIESHNTLPLSEYVYLEVHRVRSTPNYISKYWKDKYRLKRCFLFELSFLFGSSVLLSQHVA